MSEKTKKQHYVWEWYLKAWATNDQIWCKRSGKVFRTSTENVAQERYFYEVAPLNCAELSLIYELVQPGPEIDQDIKLRGLKTYLCVAHAKGDIPRFGIEWYHSMLEGKALPVLSELRQGNMDILQNKQNKIDLCAYLGHQYTRTKKSKTLPSGLRENQNFAENYKGCDLEKIHNAMAFVIANQIGSSLCDDLTLKVVKNNSGINLITSDQPIYNIMARPGLTPAELVIYMPISPVVAIFAKKQPNEEVIETPERAMDINKFMISNSHEIIFASSEEELLL